MKYKYKEIYKKIVYKLWAKKYQVSPRRYSPPLNIVLAKIS